MRHARLTIPGRLMLVATILFASGAGAGEQRGNPISGKVVLAHQIDTTGFGTWTGLRLGDLDGDGRLDIVVAKNRAQNITCVTALDVTGKRLWRIGQPHAGGTDFCVSKILDPFAFEIDTITVSSNQTALTWAGAWNCTFDVDTTTNLLDTNAWSAAPACTNLAGTESMGVTNAAIRAVECYRIRARESGP